MHFADALTERIHHCSNATVVGLDPRLDQIPVFLCEQAVAQFGRTPRAVAEAFLHFNRGILDAVADLVPAVKLQLAFYECYGPDGLWAYTETLAYAKKKGLLVIADGKRNDIGSTAEAYAAGHLGTVDVFGEMTETLAADALTVNPYLGSDGIKPFTGLCAARGKGIFVLVRTSNASADEIQGQAVGDQLMDEVVAGLVEGWGRELIGESGFSSVGAVVGATYGEEARILRNRMPNQIFLVPGFGAQGASAQDVKACFHENGTGAIVNSSRDIIFAYQKNGQPGQAYAEAARDAVVQMKEALGRLF